MDIFQKYNQNPFPLQLRLVKSIPWQSNPSTENYDTTLSPEHHEEFLADAKKDSRLLANHDYDTAGWWLQQKTNGLPTVPSDEHAHFDDQFKKPNHITFSNMSRYSAQGPEGEQRTNPLQMGQPLPHIGGAWSPHPGQDNTPPDQMKWNFTPHPTQIQTPQQKNALAKYFELPDTGEMAMGHTLTMDGQQHQSGMRYT